MTVSVQYFSVNSAGAPLTEVTINTFRMAWVIMNIVVGKVRMLDIVLSF